MSQVLIHSQQEDRPRIEPMVRGLERTGIEVVLSRQLAGDSRLSQALDEDAQQLGCVLVIWSTASPEQAAKQIQDPAIHTKERGNLLGIRIDDVELPLSLGDGQELDLIGWGGDTEDPRFLALVKAIRACQAGKQDGPKGMPKQSKRWSAALLAIAPIAAAVLGFVADVAGLQGALCQVPGVRAVCRITGLGGVPTAAEEKAWTDSLEADCDGLRDYLDAYPRGAYADEASRRITAARTKSLESWQPVKISPVLFVRQSFDSLPSEEKARQDALDRGRKEAELQCASFDGNEFRLISASLEPEHWNCEARGKGFVCGFKGKAICHVEARKVVMVEVCS